MGLNDKMKMKFESVTCPHCGGEIEGIPKYFKDLGIKTEMVKLFI